MIGVEATLRAIKQSRNENGGRLPPVTAFQQLRSAVETQSPWNKQLTTLVADFLFDILYTPSNEELLVQVLELINVSFGRWSDDLLHSACTNLGDDSNCSFVDAVYRIVMSHGSNSRIGGHCILILSRWLQTKGRIEWYTTISNSTENLSPAWVPRRTELEQTALIAKNLFMSPTNKISSPSHLSSTIQYEIRVASIQFLANMLKQNVSGWLHRSLSEQSSTDTFQDFCNRLMVESSKLNDSSLPASSCRLGLACLRMQCLIHHQYHEPLPDLARLIRSTPIVENIIKVAFPTEMSTPRGPRWTYEACDSCVRECCREVIKVWGLACEGEAWTSFCQVKHLWQTFAHETWKNVVLGEEKVVKFEMSLPSLLLLQRVIDRATFSDTLTSSLSRLGNGEPPYQQLLSSLSLCHHESFVISASSLAIFGGLLCDRPNSPFKDELSQKLWKTVEDTESDCYVEIFLELLGKLYSEDRCESQLLCICNIVQSLAASTACCCGFLARNSADTLLSCLGRFLSSGNNDATSSQNPSQASVFEEDTPKMGNLENEKTFFSVVKSHDKHFSELNGAIQISVATILARLGWCTVDPSSEHLSLLQGNIRTAVTECVLELSSCISRQEISHNQMRRFVTLGWFLASCSQDMEGLVSSVLVASEVNRAQETQRQREELSTCQRELAAMTEKASRLEEERNDCLDELTSQRLLNEKELNRVRIKVSNDASRVVQMHAAERSKAHDHASECMRRLAEAEKKQGEAENAVEASQACQDLMRSELSEATEKAVALQSELDVQKCRVSEIETQSLQSSRDLKLATEENNKVKEMLQQKEQEVANASCAVSKAQSTSKDINHDLEETYSNLVALVRVYEDKEKEAETIKQEHEKAMSKVMKKLQSEKSRNGMLEDSEDRLQRENDRLLKKLGRAKEKLEEERRDRYEESERRKRSGPVSYINQLHDESMERDRSRRKNRSAYAGKENSYQESSMSSSSRRRKHLY